MKALGAALVLVVAAAGGAAAQCSDGSAPPCGQRGSVARPLDDRNWLVLPFDNLARDPALDVVRDASVTLLYSAMSQWSDLLVVDDARVADLMRGVRTQGRLGQEATFALARQVGAGRLVTGTLLMEGPRTRLQAAVFDVRSGRRLRSPSVMTVGTDSLSAVFSDLAQQVIALPVPAGVRPAEVGTQSTEALRAYAAGLEAERRMVQDSAAMHYRRAVALDSAFGLAHYHLSQTLSDLPDQEPGAVGRALAAAQRFAATLPRRERSQVAAALAAGRGDWRTACEIGDRAMAADSLDAWPWFWRGVCTAQLLPRDSTAFQARLASDNAILSAWTRAAALDSSYYAPILSLVNLLRPATYCRINVPTVYCPDSELFETVKFVDNDTLVHQLHRPFLEGRGFHQTVEAVAARRRMAELSRDIVSRFVTANPGHVGAHLQLAAILFRLSDIAGAERELEAARGAARLRDWRRIYYINRFYIELTRGRPAIASVFADSVYGDVTAAGQPQAGAILGRFSLDAAATHRGVDSLISMRQAWLPVFAGVLPPDWDRLLERYANAYALSFTGNVNRQPAIVRAVMSHGDLVAFFMRRRRAAADTAHPEPIYQFQAWFALGDTARARRALGASDTEIDRRAPNAVDDGAWLFNAEGHVLLADSTAALSRLRGFFNRRPRSVDLTFTGLMSERGLPTNSMTRAEGRARLLYADLATAAGSRDEARGEYQLVVDLWSGGEAPVQPLVARARAALATLGPVRR